MDAQKKYFYTYQMMIVFSLVCGVMSIVVQLLEGFEAIGFVLAVSGIAGLTGVWKGKTASEPHLAEKCYKTAFEWLLLVIMVAMAFLMTSNGFRIFPKANDFLSTHWPGLVLSMMCIVLAISGLRKTKEPQNA
jgi:hypothetical protein